MTSKVPAAPWDPATVATRSLAEHVSPAGTLVEEVEDVDEGPVVGPPAVVGAELDGDEHAESPTALDTATTTTPHRRQGRNDELFRS